MYCDKRANAGEYHARVKERGSKYRLDSVDDKFCKSSSSVWIHLLTKHELGGLEWAVINENEGEIYS